MEAVNFEQANTNLGPPKGKTEDEVGTLRVFRGESADGQKVVISKWKLTKEEVAHLLAGECLYLWVYGETMPPVALDTESPFE